MTTTTSAATGSTATMALGRLVGGAWEPKNCSNSILGGLVAITAGCAAVEAYGAF
jgi:ammonia channel protein AmtB